MPGINASELRAVEDYMQRAMKEIVHESSESDAVESIDFNLINSDDYELMPKYRNTNDDEWHIR